MNAIGMSQRLTGRITVALPPVDAFRLFTPRGEQEWMPGWQPRLPAEPTDDTVPGTVFETDADGMTTIWVVVDRVVGRWIRYARIVPGSMASTVTVALDEVGGQSEVTVTYELTALSDVGRLRLREFATADPAFMASWQEAIAASVGGPRAATRAVRRGQS